MKRRDRCFNDHALEEPHLQDQLLADKSGDD
jgi:hypothetical protein